MLEVNIITKLVSAIACILWNFTNVFLLVTGTLGFALPITHEVK